MALFRLGQSSEPTQLVRGEGLYLRPADMPDFPQWAQLRADSRAFLTPWEPVWPSDDLTRAAFRRRLRRYREEAVDDEAWHFLIFRDADSALIGGLTLGNIRRGVAQTATLGYWMGEAYAGRGHMTRAVRAIAGHAFAALRLHRIEAACIPDNAASARLLTRNGFAREGFARAYLRINGAWRDHDLYALLESDPMPALGPPP